MQRERGRAGGKRRMKGTAESVKEEEDSWGGAQAVDIRTKGKAENEG